MSENQMYGEMMKAARRQLEGRDPVKIAENAGIDFLESKFRFASLGISICVSYPEYEITAVIQTSEKEQEYTLEEWHQLVILHYLAMADGTELSLNNISFGQQKEGMIRGGGFDRKAEGEIERYIGKIDLDILRKRCLELGGTEQKSQADLSVKFLFLPRYPVTLNFWLADEEFPASGRLLLNKSAEHYLSVEDSVTVGELVLTFLGTGLVTG